jgi:hypothetical protein
MPLSIQGIGTTYYGVRDTRNDGSYVTTEWAIVAFVPIIPLRTLRVVKSGYASGTFMWSRQPYLVCECLPLDLRQVISVYGFTIGTLAWTVLWLSFLAGRGTDQNWLWLFWFLGSLVPFALLWLVRRRKSARAGQ